ncbi:MAG: methyltransferase [Candidatus Paceibacterota bacterium]|jgi:protein-S-isoprenylcysteine O-methyltransferase Ste14
MTENTAEQFGHINIHKNKVHKILAHSYIFYFLFFIFGLFLDFIFPLKLFENMAISSIGALFLIFGTFLIFWAQKVSRNLKKESISKKSFCQGPYCFTRSPTHFGLFITMLGFGIMINALFIVIFSIISFFITKFVFLKKEEKILAEKYGTPYLEYKKSVKF